MHSEIPRPSNKHSAKYLNRPAERWGALSSFSVVVTKDVPPPARGATADGFTPVQDLLTEADMRGHLSKPPPSSQRLRMLAPMLGQLGFSVIACKRIGVCHRSLF